MLWMHKFTKRERGGGRREGRLEWDEGDKRRSAFSSLSFLLFSRTHTHPSKIADEEGVLPVWFTGINGGPPCGERPVGRPVGLYPGLHRPSQLLRIETGGT